MPKSPQGGLRGALLVCGTASDAGKSHLVTGLCRVLVRRGVKAAPFKGQNMSLNSFATPSGHEIGRSQAIQAVAARVEPEPAMNPVLLKPMIGQRSQVVVMGRPAGETDPSSYARSRAEDLRPVVLEAFADLRSRFDVVVAEGAGSPAEVNLLASDLANLWLAVATGTPAILVGDIERGGVFAALYGTVGILPQDLAGAVKGYVINKFRGDPRLLERGIEELEARTGRPVLGVVPYARDLGLDAEDSLGMDEAVRPLAAPAVAAAAHSDVIDVAVVALPHIANFTDLDPLRLEPAVSLRLVRSGQALGDPDLLIVPGSKTTVADLAWLGESGLAGEVRRAARRPGGPVVLGICAGYQMLGEEIVDGGVESRAGRVGALGLLPVRTVFGPGKTTRPRRGKAFGSEVQGYEIRHGETEPLAGVRGTPRAFAYLEDGFGNGPEGARTADGRVVGTSLHGLFECDEFRAAFVTEVAALRHKRWTPSGASFAAAREGQIDRLADLVEAHLDLGEIFRLISAAGSPR